MASMIDSPYEFPGGMSRGAIQQRPPRDSILVQMVSATVLSFDE